MADRLIIRHATDSDEEAVRRVFERAFETIRPIYRPKQDTVKRQQKHWSEGKRLVAVLDGNVVGTVQFRKGKRFVDLIGLAVDPGYHRQGIGRCLVEEVTKLAPGLGRHTVATNTIRETGNVDFFERLGFKVVRESVATWCESDKFAELHSVELERYWTVGITKR